VEPITKALHVRLVARDVALAKSMEERYGKYVVVCTDELWGRGNWKEIVKWLAHSHCVIHVGRGQEPFDIESKNYISLVGRTTISQTAALLDSSHLFIGCDDWLNHVTNAVQKRSVIVFGGDSNGRCYAHNKNLSCNATVDEVKKAIKIQLKYIEDFAKAI